MADSDTFSALRVRRRLEEIAAAIADARVSGDVYAGLDAVEHAVLAVMDEVAELAQALAEVKRRAAERDSRGFGERIRRLVPFRSGQSA